MKFFLASLVVFSLLLSGCAVVAPPPTPTVTPTDVPTATVPPCTRDDYLDSTEALVHEWTDAVAIAAATSRIALSGPVSDLQDIHRRSETLPIRDCYQSVHQHLVSYQAATIDAFLGYMNNQYLRVKDAGQIVEDETAAWDAALELLP